MAYTAVPTVTTGELWTAANHNTYIRDNFAAGVPDIFTTKGDIAVATDANAASRVGVGSDGDVLVADSGETEGVIFGQISPILVPCIGVVNVTDSTYYDELIYQGPVMEDDKETYALGQFAIPYTATVQVSAIIIASGAGNLYGHLRYYAGTSGELWSTHSGIPADSTAAITTNYRNKIYQRTISDVVKGDMVNVALSRDATNAADTINIDAYCAGFLVEFS